SSSVITSGPTRSRSHALAKSTSTKRRSGIMARRCEGLSLDAYVFTRPSGGAYSNMNLAERFQTVRNRAGVRSTITIYSFRHLWVSEMLVAGVDVLLVARMAGTSVAMIERVYGHFRNQSYQEAKAR